jgi:chemosensory pili system protein ChpC
MSQVNQPDRLPLNERVSEVYCLLLPLAASRLLLPRACVAEVVSYQLPTQLPGVPPWLLGTVRWSDAQLPLVSFEGVCQQVQPPASSRTRIVVMHTLGDRLNSANYGLLVQGFPQLLRVSADMLVPDAAFSPDERVPVLSRARMLKDSPLIPDLDLLEHMLADELPPPASD